MIIVAFYFFHTLFKNFRKGLWYGHNSIIFLGYTSIIKWRRQRLHRSLSFTKVRFERNQLCGCRPSPNKQVNFLYRFFFSLPLFAGTWKCTGTFFIRKNFFATKKAVQLSSYRHSPEMVGVEPTRPRRTYRISSATSYDHLSTSPCFSIIRCFLLLVKQKIYFIDHILIK